MKYFISLVTCLFFVAQVSFANERMSLNSFDGQKWQLFSSAIVTGAEVRGASPSWQPSEYIDGIVPGTVFAAYVAAGKEEDPNYSDNIYNVDESKYNVAYWYRTTFDRPQQSANKRTILVFEGVNRSATVYLNKHKLGTIKGHVLKVSYDITDMLQDQDNLLAVKIQMPSGDFLGRDKSFVNYTCPTYVASHSWDWMPYVPGLNTGITNDVYIDFAGEATLRDPWIQSTLTTNYNRATIHPATSVMNLTAEPMSVQVKATINPGNVEVTKDVTLAANDSVDVQMPDVKITSPKLWWPNGYGEQNLYSCNFEIYKDGQLIDSKTQSFGICEYKYKKENTAFVVYVNGKKVYCKGGNWGMSEYMLRTRGEEYDTRIKLHQDMHFNMIRCWTGCVTDEEFYDACDKYGIMVWDDFWLTGPYVGLTGPNDRTEWLSNAKDKIVRLRNHPCEAVWCADNEGWPYDELNDAIRDLIQEYDGGNRVYMPNSHNGYYTRNAYEAQDDSGWGLSGSGWWTSYWPEDYFDDGIWGGGGDKGDCVDWGFRSELGTGAFETYESMKEFTPEDKLWPRNDIWEKHFFSDKAEYGGGASASNYFDKVQTCYGESTSAEQYCERAQLFNIEVAKGLFEGWNQHLWEDATGVLLWMSQPAYPSHLWQTYDYYFDMTGIYWGAKKGCEPVHIQWDCDNNDVSIINTTHEDLTGLNMSLEVYKYTGKKQDSMCGEYTNLSSYSNSVTKVTNLSIPDDGHTGKLTSVVGVYFIRLKLTDADGNLVSQNYYWRCNGTSHNYKTLNNIADANTECEVLSSDVDEDGIRHMTVQLSNPTSTVAFALRLRLEDANGKRILPVIMDENYITLMPGETTTVNLEYKDSLCEGDPVILLKQYNCKERVAATVDGIQDLTPTLSQGEGVYNLAGQKVDETYKGMVIRNGKKLLKK